MDIHRYGYTTVQDDSLDGGHSGFDSALNLLPKQCNNSFNYYLKELLYVLTGRRVRTIRNRMLRDLPDNKDILFFGVILILEERVVLVEHYLQRELVLFILLGCASESLLGLFEFLYYLSQLSRYGSYEEVAELITQYLVQSTID